MEDDSYMHPEHPRWFEFLQRVACAAGLQTALLDRPLGFRDILQRTHMLRCAGTTDAVDQVLIEMGYGMKSCSSCDCLFFQSLGISTIRALLQDADC